VAARTAGHSAPRGGDPPIGRIGLSERPRIQTRSHCGEQAEAAVTQYATDIADMPPPLEAITLNGTSYRVGRISNEQLALCIQYLRGFGKLTNFHEEVARVVQALLSEHQPDLTAAKIEEALHTPDMSALINSVHQELLRRYKRMLLSIAQKPTSLSESDKASPLEHVCLPDGKTYRIGLLNAEQLKQANAIAMSIHHHAAPSEEAAVTDLLALFLSEHHSEMTREDIGRAVRGYLPETLRQLAVELTRQLMRASPLFRIH
jgi:hypothetical protein